MVFEGEQTLGDVAELVRGVAYKPEALLTGAEPEAVPLLRATNIGARRIDLGDVLYVPPQLVKKAQRVRKFDVLIAMSSGSRAAVGRLAQLRSDWSGTFGAFCGVLRANEERVDPEFLGYLLYAPAFRARIETHAAGTAIMNLSREHLLGFQVFLPPVRDQRAIADLLGMLDDRIDLLRQTNATLESIAQALFKSWFIDFDPVRAKAKGREPEGMDAATAALFPSEFEESALGAIPKGWAVQPIGELVEAVGGSTPDTKNEAYWEPATHHWTSPKDLSGATAPVLLDTERKVSASGLAKISSGLLPVGTLLMSSRAPIGYLSLAQIPVAINQGYIAMLPGGRLSPTYLYFWCKLHMDAIKGRANGSTFMEISKKAFRPIPAVLPPREVIESFTGIADSVFRRLTANERQARELAEIRDTILPRLISGKLRLPEAQEQIDEVCA